MSVLTLAPRGPGYSYLLAWQIRLRAGNLSTVHTEAAVRRRPGRPGPLPALRVTSVVGVRVMGDD
eukprot:748843-Hanusia_phi.AAC.4